MVTFYNGLLYMLVNIYKGSGGICAIYGQTVQHKCEILVLALCRLAWSDQTN
jgi:hypothetical protein